MQNVCENFMWRVWLNEGEQQGQHTPPPPPPTVLKSRSFCVSRHLANSSCIYAASWKVTVHLQNTRAGRGLTHFVNMTLWVPPCRCNPPGCTFSQPVPIPCPPLATTLTWPNEVTSIFLWLTIRIVGQNGYHTLHTLGVAFKVDTGLNGWRL